jgi:DMSO/TMAO reductase YedYZ molybdopterin-dependent catalytic subunit
MILGAFIVVIIGLGTVFYYGSLSKSEPVQPSTSGSEASKPDVGIVDETSSDLSDLITMDPTEVDNTNLPVTPTYKLHLTGSAQRVDISQYHLTVNGLVDTPLSISYNELLMYPSVTEVVLLICPYVFADNAEWTGIPVASILDEAGVSPNASTVIFYSVDGYQSSLNIREAQKDGVFLAYMVNGQTLPAEHGYPLRLVVTGRYGANWVKWLERIEVR